MIHTDSVKAWAAENETFRSIIIERNKEIAHLVIANDALGRRINELEGEIERLTAESDKHRKLWLDTLEWSARMRKEIEVLKYGATLSD